MKLEIVPRTVGEAERCARWWRENRPAAHLFFEEDLRGAVEGLSTTLRSSTSLGRADRVAENRHTLYD